MGFFVVVFFLHSCVITLPGYLFFHLFQIVGCGNFATVWRGTYHNSTVAVKVFPAGWKHIFTAEKEVYELPLMKHSGIIDFLGSGRKQDGESWLIVLQLAECVSGRRLIILKRNNLFCSIDFFLLFQKIDCSNWIRRKSKDKMIEGKTQFIIVLK